MKTVKSLLLGSAAGLVAVTAGQAADLPVKAPAQPVEYVKVCTLYGAGFYYMPGTDMCIKIGGWTRAEVTDGTNGSIAWGPFNANTNSRATNNLTVRARGYITADAREETEFGVARAYIDVGLSTSTLGADNASNTFSSNRAFLQWAGFTAGLSRSFYDFFNAAVQNYRAGYFPQEDTGDAGWWVWAYTAQLGGGLSATISAEERRTTQIVGATGAALTAGTLLGGVGSLGGYGGWQVPDIVGNLRLDETWGSAQIMAAGHQLNPLYYGPLQTSGHASDNFGWAAGVGAHINTPFIWQGDYVEGEFNYSVGAQQYIADSTRTNLLFASGGKQSWGIQSDCVFASAGSLTTTSAARNGTRCEQTTGWSAIASYEHYWTPQWHQSFTGGYMATRYSDAANDILCSIEGRGTGTTPTAGARANPGCNNNWNYWVVGSRLQWDVTKSFYLGVEALYLQQDTAKSGTGLVPGAVGLGPPSLCSLGGCTESNEHTWAFTVRMHKDFLP